MAEDARDPWNRRATVTGKHALSQDELQAVLRAEDQLRKRALLATAAGTGIRRGDIVRLERANLYMVGPEPPIAVRIDFFEQKKAGPEDRDSPGPTGRPWRAWLPPDLAQPLRTWLDMTTGQATRYIWPSKRSQTGHIASKTAYNWFQDALNKAGLEPRPFHALRSTCIKLLKQAGWTDEAIMEQTGDTLEVIQQHYLTPTETEMASTARQTELLS